MTSPTLATSTLASAVPVVSALTSGLTEQVHALRHSADLLTAAGVCGLSLTFNQDRISIQVGAELGDPAQRTAMVTHLAHTAGTRARRWGGTGPTADWITADGVWAGHRLHIFTPIGACP